MGKVMTPAEQANNVAYIAGSLPGYGGMKNFVISTIRINYDGGFLQMQGDYLVQKGEEFVKMGEWFWGRDPETHRLYRGAWVSDDAPAAFDLKNQTADLVHAAYETGEGIIAIEPLTEMPVVKVRHRGCAGDLPVVVQKPKVATHRMLQTPQPLPPKPVRIAPVEQPAPAPAPAEVKEEPKQVAVETKVETKKAPSIAQGTVKATSSKAAEIFARMTEGDAKAFVELGMSEDVAAQLAESVKTDDVIIEKAADLRKIDGVGAREFMSMRKALAALDAE